MITPTLILEKKLWKEGFVHVAGVDEAGKGPWAGPVTAGAVVIHRSSQVVSPVRDSKLMSALQREKVFDAICKQSSAFGIGIVDASEIDTIGIDVAVKKAMLTALSSLETMLGDQLSYVIVDGSKTKPLTQYATLRIFKGGLYHYTIAAGSILAKVTRDRLMKEYARDYPQYGFEKHVGYGTKLHQEMLHTYGPCAIHRKSYRPVKSLLPIS